VSRALAIPARQVTALCKGAAKAGCIAEVKIGDVVVRLVPEDSAQSERPIDAPVNPEDFQSLEQYLAWRKRQGDYRD